MLKRNPRPRKPSKNSRACACRTAPCSSRTRSNSEFHNRLWGTGCGEAELHLDSLAETLVIRSAMHSLTKRRDFLKTFVKSGLFVGGWGATRPGCLSAVEPFARRGRARLELSLAAYSFRDYLNH